MATSSVIPRGKRDIKFIQTAQIPTKVIKLNNDQISEECFEPTVETKMKQIQAQSESDAPQAPAAGNSVETLKSDYRSVVRANVPESRTSNESFDLKEAERSMAMSNKAKVSHLYYLTQHGGTKLVRALFLKQVTEVRPETEDPATWTVAMFLNRNKETITSSKFYRQANSFIFPAEGQDANLDQWDLSLFLNILKATCKLNPDMLMRLSALKKIRNKLAHLGDSNIEDTKYKINFHKIRIIFDAVLKNIDDEELEKNIRDMLQKAENGEIPDNELGESLQALHRSFGELTNTVKCEHIETRQTFEKGKTELLAEITSLKEMLSAGKDNGFSGPPIAVKLKPKNIPTELDQHLSHVMVNMFSEEIKKITGSYDTPDKQKMREAVHTFYKSLKEKGYEILKAEEGCILLHIQFLSFTSVLSFYAEYIDGSLDNYLLELQKAAGHFLNFQEFLIEMNLYEEDCHEVIAYIRDYVENINKTRTETHQHEGQQCIPTKEIYETDGGRTSVLLTVKPPSHFAQIDLERILDSELKILSNAFNLDESMEEGIVEDGAATDSAADTHERGKETEPTGDTALTETPGKLDELREDSNNITRDSNIDRGSNEMHEKYHDATHRKTEEISRFRSESGRRDAERYELEEIALFGLTSVKEYVVRRNNEWKDIPVNIGLTGTSGTGKSSFINALTGLKTGHIYQKRGIHAILTGTTQYPHPNNNNIIFWDMPGVNTTLFQRNSYLQSSLLNKYDVFLIILDKTFPKDLKWLVQQVKSRGKQCLFIRTHTDVDVINDKRQNPNNHTAETTLDRIRQNFIKSLKEDGIETDEVFLIDSNKTYLYDFDKLTASLINGISDKKKREAFVLTLPSLSESVINEKRTALESRICRVALCSALTGTAPVPLMDATVDTVLIMGETDEYRRQFGLTEDQLQAKLLDSEIILKFNRHFVFLSTETLFSITADVVAEGYIKNKLPFLINDKSVILSYNVTCIALRNILNALAEDALKVNRLASLLS